MLQIKTIKRADPELFDELVNAALAAGWTLARRLTCPDAFIAELEIELPDEAEETCENCRYRGTHPEQEPCFSCSETCSEWEAEA